MPLDLTYHVLPTSECLADEIPQRQLHRLLYETRSKSGPISATMHPQAFMCMSVFKRTQLLHTFKTTFCLFWQNWVNATHAEKCCRCDVMISRIALCLAIRRALFSSRVRNFQPFKACRADFCSFRHAHRWAHSYLLTTYSTYQTNFEFVQSRHSDSRAGDGTLASDNTSTRTWCPSGF